MGLLWCPLVLWSFLYSVLSNVDSMSWLLRRSLDTVALMTRLSAREFMASKSCRFSEVQRDIRDFFLQSGFWLLSFRWWGVWDLMFLFVRASSLRARVGESRRFLAPFFSRTPITLNVSNQRCQNCCDRGSSTLYCTT